MHEILELIPLEYKAERQRREMYCGQPRLPLLRVAAFAALWAFARYECRPEVTEVFRTEEEQRRIYPGEPAKKSVHQYWRGCDMVLRGLGPEEHSQVRDAVNSLFPYSKPGHLTCIYHDAGSGPHLHFQVGA
jgi:hypothetical protein